MCYNGNAMDFAKPVNARAAKPGRWWRVTLASALGVLVLAAAAVAAAPAALSTGAARRFILGRVNAAIAPATLEVADWSLAWRTGQTIEGIVYRDARQGVEATVRRVRLSPLWALLPLGKVTAVVEVEAPAVAFAPPPEPEAAAEPAPPAQEAAPSPGRIAPPTLPAWEVEARLTVREGTFAMAGLPAPLVTGLEAEVTLPSLRAPIAARVAGRALGAAFSAEAVATAAERLIAARAPNDFFTTLAAKIDAPWLDLRLSAKAEPGQAWPSASLTAGTDFARAWALVRELGAEAPGLEAVEGSALMVATLGNGATPGLARVEASARTSGAACRFQGKRIALDPAFAATAELDPANPLGAEIEGLALTLPGVALSGKGSLEAGELTAQVAVAEALAAARPFVGEIPLPGPLAVTLRARAKAGDLDLSAKVASGAADLLTASVAIKGVDVAAQRLAGATLSAQADLAAAMAYLGKDTPAIRGTMRAEAKTDALALDTLAESLPRVTAGVAIPDLSVTTPELGALALPLTLETALSGDRTRLALESLAVTTPYLGLTARGTFEPGTGMVALEGSAEPDFAAIWALPPMAPYREMGIAVTGRHARPFRFEGPVTQGAAGILNNGRAEASLAFDRVTLPGLDVPGGSATLTLADAVARLDAQASLNGGSVRLTPQVTLAAPPYVLTLPQGAKVLDGVGLTQDLLDAGLGAVNPLLRGAATPTGRIDVTCGGVRMTLGDDPLATLDAALTLATSGVSLTPNGLLGTVLAFGHEGGRRVEVPDQSLGVRIAKGILTSDDLSMRIGSVRVACSGSTDLATRALNHSLDFSSKSVADGRVFSLPVTGTLDKPRVETGALVAALREAALDKTSDKLSEKLSEKLGKALRKRAGREGEEAGRDAGKALGDKLDNALRGLFGR